MRIMTGLLVLCALPVTAYAQQPSSDGKIQVPERKLDSKLKGETPPNERRPANPSDERAGQQTHSHPYMRFVFYHQVSMLTIINYQNLSLLLAQRLLRESDAAHEFCEARV